jgi:hypothetical protein
MNARRTKMEIVKVQLPLSSNEQTPMALVYNESRTYMVQIIVNQALLDKMDGHVKRYFLAGIPPDKKIYLVEPAEDQTW